MLGDAPFAEFKWSSVTTVLSELAHKSTFTVNEAGWYRLGGQGEVAEYIPGDTPFAPPSPRTKPPRVREEKILTAGMKYLRAQPYTHVRKVHGNQYSAGEPDVDAVISGLSVKLECKVPGKKPTELQVAVMRKWASAGALVGWFTSVEHVQQLLHHLGERDFIADLRYPGCSCPSHKE